MNVASVRLPRCEEHTSAMPDLVSIIMPAYNAEAHIAEAVESVVRQSFLHWELLVVDDCSTDRTASVIHGFAAQDVRVRYLKTAQNGGPASARNLGTESAKRRYIAFLDSDDLWDAHKLETQTAALTDAGAALCFSSYRVMIDGVVREKPFLAPPTVTYSQMLRGSVIGCLTVVYDTVLLGKHYFHADDSLLRNSWYGLFLNRVAHEDYAAWLAMLKGLEADGIPAPVGITEPLATYRLCAQSFSSRKWKMALSQWLIYRKYERLGLLESCYYFLRYGFRGLGKYRQSPALTMFPASAGAHARAVARLRQERWGEAE